MKVNLYLEDRVPRETGLYAVMLRINVDGKVYYCQIMKDGERLYKSRAEFDEVATVSKPKAKYQALYDYLHGVIAYAKGIINGLKHFDIAVFKKELYGGKVVKDNIIVRYQERIKELTTSGNINTAENYALSLRSVLLYHASTKGITIKPNTSQHDIIKAVPLLPFDLITAKYLHSYERYMLGIGKKLSTVGIYLRPLRAIFNEAKRTGIITAEIYPFGKAPLYEIPAATKVKKSLNSDELYTLYSADVPHGTERHKARSFWFFSYYCNGMNIADIVRLKYRDIDKDVLTFYRTKIKNTTRGDQKPVIVILDPEALKVIDQYGNEDKSPDSYIFPVLTKGMTAAQQASKGKAFTKFVNQHIKLLARDIGITPLISTNWARHTFTTEGMINGATIEFMRIALRHTDTKTTQRYFSGFPESINRDMIKGLSNFKTKKKDKPE